MLMQPLSKLPDLENQFNKLKKLIPMTITGRFAKAFEGTIKANAEIINLSNELMKVADSSDKKTELYQLAGKILTQSSKIVEAFEEPKEEVQSTIN